MAEITIPPPDAAGYWHFVYVTTDLETGEWYGGKRSTRKHPLSDRYLGSGYWIKKHKARNRLKREIVAFYANSVEVYAAEAKMITWSVILNDPLCMNQRDGGEGMSVESVRRWLDSPEGQASRRRMYEDPSWRASVAAAGRRMAADPEWQKRHAEFIVKRTADPKWRLAQAKGIEKRTEDPEWQKKHADNLRRLHKNPDAQAKIAASNRRLSTDPAWLAANTAMLHERHANPEWRAKNADMLRRRGADPEFRAKASAGAHRRYSDPAERVKLSAAAFRREAAKRAAKAIMG